MPHSLHLQYKMLDLGFLWYTFKPLNKLLLKIHEGETKA